eukprot:TRINITY_DN65061_c0_g1_i1.p1 TRINITY_DN65061_c0_g1~~TRINITY_DN65061_c0_g1_i1.p1  ORF type:complete len:127 (+),score=0.84 TRINITY_DN65061_c0_g1_i1:83-463(+)
MNTMTTVCLEQEEKPSEFENLTIEIDSDAERASLETSYITTQFDDFQHSENYFHIYMNKCHRQTMQDRCQYLTKLQNQAEEPFFAVFDGHGSEKIAEFLANNMHSYIVQNPKYNTDVKSAIIEAFK